jgi:hypothetical protein
MDGQTENPNCSTISILHENPLHFNVCEQNFSPSTSQNMQISGERERERERDLRTWIKSKTKLAANKE